jgi:poly(A) polymerase
MKGVEQPAEFHPEGDVYVHTMLGLDIAVQKIKERDSVLMWSVLLHDAGKPGTITYPEKAGEDRIRFNNHDLESSRISEEVLTRFKQPNKLIEAVSYVVKNHMRIGTAMKMRRGKLKLMLAGETFPYELALQMVDCLSSHGDLDVYKFLKAEYEKFKQENALPPKIVNGEFLIKLGYKPSPLFAEIIEQCYEAQLEAIIRNEEEAAAFIKGKW